MSRILAAAAPGLPTRLPGDPNWDHPAMGCSRAMAAAVIASAQPEPLDAELLDLGGRWQAVRQEWARFSNPALVISDDDASRVEDELACAERWLTEAITALPARTAAGLAVKARVLAVAHDCNEHRDVAIAAWAQALPRDGVHLDMAIGSLVRDLLRLAQEQPR